MPRLRTIKTEFWTSEQVVECSPLARLLFIGIWNFCDDGGVHPANARRLKMEVFPADPIGADEIERLVDELIRAGLLREYQAAGATFWHVTGWGRHQRIHKPTLVHPPPPEDGSAPVGDGRAPSTDGRESADAAGCKVADSIAPVADGSAPVRYRPRPNGVEWSGVEWNRSPPTPPEGGGGGKESDRADRAAGDEQATGDVAARLVCEFYGAWRGADYRPPPAKLPAQIAAVGERIERHGLDLVRRGMRALPERLQREFPECREGLPAAWRLLDRILESLAAERRAKDRRRDEEAERRREEEARAAERAAWLERRPALMDRWRALSEPERAAIADAVPGAARLPAPLLLDECLRRMRDGDGGGC